MNEQNLLSFELGNSRSLARYRPAIADLFTLPRQVMDSVSLNTAEKRAILASWISDVRAVKNAPRLRRLDNGSLIHVDDILQALRSLDGDDADAEPKQSQLRPSHSQRKLLRR